VCKTTENRSCKRVTSYLFQELENTLISEWHLGRVDVKLYHLGMLCIHGFSSLSIEECHNILPCERALTKLNKQRYTLMLILSCVMQYIKYRLVSGCNAGSICSPLEKIGTHTQWIQYRPRTDTYLPYRQCNYLTLQVVPKKPTDTAECRQSTFDLSRRPLGCSWYQSQLWSCWH